MNQIAQFVKTERKKAGLTQEDFSIRSGLGLRFVRELEQGKETCRMDKVNHALSMFGCTLGVVRMPREEEMEK
ncbi:MAG: helix-turn-helix transcriptional regulator [Treponema sp.]|jgi:y4mF family transcriptional regulator|nr:helix-turn-helix transcriptional regulator [bacterium]MBR4630577.1 helix-turn-helix transcriptional regulator [Treponema sp.]